MWQILINVLMAVSSAIVPRVLAALGMSIVSYAAFSTLADTVVSEVKSSYTSLDTTMLSLLDMAGFGTAVNILASAIVSSAGLMAIKRLRVK